MNNQVQFCMSHPTTVATKYVQQQQVWACNNCAEMLKTFGLTILDEPPYNFWEHLNRSGSTDSIIIEINPTEDENKCIMQIPPMKLNSIMHQTRDIIIPTVSFVGSTGTGKSFLISSLIPDRDSKVKPAVAVQNQAAPTSAHVHMYYGEVEGQPIALIDSEGYNCSIVAPTTFAKNFGTNQLQNIFAKAMGENGARKKLIQTIVPAMTYLMSDVIVFIDTVELHDERFVTKIMEFIRQCHITFTSCAWKPALVIVHNKCVRQSNDNFLVTNLYENYIAELKTFFSNIELVRLPDAVGNSEQFQSGRNTLNQVLYHSIVEVQINRESSKCLYTEKTWLTLVNCMIKKYHKSNVLLSLTELFHDNFGFGGNTPNVTKMFRLIKNHSPNDTFNQTVIKVYKWVAYTIVANTRKDNTLNTLRERPEEIVKQELISEINNQLLQQETCNACLNEDGKTYYCQLIKQGHGGVHKNRALLSRPTANTFKYIISIGFWKDRIPCTWRGNHEGSQIKHNLYDFVKAYANMSEGKFHTSSSEIWPPNFFEANVGEVKDNVCYFCLKDRSNEPFIYLNACGHDLCEHCASKFVIESSLHKIKCPFCRQSSLNGLQRMTSELTGKRILSLDGGGLMGLFQLRVLVAIEQMFSPLPIYNLFDVIAGTSVGGLIALGVLSRQNLTFLKSKIEEFASEILTPVSSWYLGWCGLAGNAALNDTLFAQRLSEIFRNSLKRYTSTSPRVFVTSYCHTLQQCLLLGNFPELFPAQGYQLVNDVMCAQAAQATASVPVYFKPTVFRPCDQEEPFICYDGALASNNPIKYAIKVAEKECPQATLDFLLSIGAGSPADTIVSVNAGFLKLTADYVKNILLNGDNIWKTNIEDEVKYNNVNKARINFKPDNSLNPLDYRSIRGIKHEIESTFNSEVGRSSLNDIFNMIFASLWLIKAKSGTFRKGQQEDVAIVNREHSFEYAYATIIERFRNEGHFFVQYGHGESEKLNISLRNCEITKTNDSETYAYHFKVSVPADVNELAIYAYWVSTSNVKYRVSCCPSVINVN